MKHDHGYWTKGADWIPVAEDHLVPIMEDPSRFGLSRDEIDSVYAAAGETMGSEGSARDAIVRRATENGWIRVRNFNNVGTRVVVQCTQMNKRIPSIQEFVSEMAKRQVISGEVTIVLSDYADGESRTFNVGFCGDDGCIDGDLTEA